MCDGQPFSKELATWIPFAAAAQAGVNGFDIAPPAHGIYALRVTAVGDADVASVRSKYMASDFFLALRGVDAASETFFASLGFGKDWGWVNERSASQRLARLERIAFEGGRLACPLIYIGCANNLRRRMTELATWGHTANHPFWALQNAGWSVEVGLLPTPEGGERKAEARLKEKYAAKHGGALPALVAR